MIVKLNMKDKTKVKSKKINWYSINENFWDRINEKVSVKKVILPIMIGILFFLSLIWGKIAYKYITKNIFANDMENIIRINENPIFSVEKIYLCSSANAIDNTVEQKLDRLGLYQFTDIAVYINNNRDDGLIEKNTIKELYIDDIDIDLDYNIGKTSLVYTNLLKLGSREELANMIFTSKNVQKDKIEFNILNSNEENEVADYEEPTFYADCSNPITLKYINEINTEYSVDKNTSATFDGSILEKVGIKTEDINSRISFRINIVNNSDEYYSNCVSFRIPLNEINKGTSIKSKTLTVDEGPFLGRGKKLT